MQQLQASRPPTVTSDQWALLAFSLGLAMLSFSTTSYESLALFTDLFVMVNVILVALLIQEAFQTRFWGKAILAISSLYFFWVEARHAAYRSPPFPVPGGVPILELQFSQTLVQQAFFYIAIFQLMLFVGYSFCPRTPRLVSWVTSRVDSSAHLAWKFRYALVACAWVSLLFRAKFQLDSAIGALVAGRNWEGIGAQDIGLVHHLGNFGLYGAALFLSDALVFRAAGQLWPLLLGGLASLPYIMFDGARHLWLCIVFPTCILAAIRFGSRITFRQKIALAVLAALVLVVVQLQLLLRSSGWENVASVTLDQLLQFGDSTGQFAALLFAEYLVPDVHGYFMEPTTPYFILHWIPRAFWPDKPIMQSWMYYNTAYTQGQFFNVTPSVIGQFYINWGLLGVLFIGGWLGLLTSVADSLLRAINIDRQRAMAAVLGMLYAFIVSSFRFYSPVYFTYLMAGFLGMLLLSHNQRASREGHAIESCISNKKLLPAEKAVQKPG